MKNNKCAPVGTLLELMRDKIKKHGIQNVR